MKLSKKLLLHLFFALFGYTINRLFRPAFFYFFDTTYAPIALLISLLITLVLPIALTMFFLKAPSYKKHLINGILTALFTSVSIFIEIALYRAHSMTGMDWFHVFTSIFSKTFLGTLISLPLALLFPKKSTLQMETKRNILDSE